MNLPLYSPVAPSGGRNPSRSAEWINEQSEKRSFIQSNQCSKPCRLLEELPAADGADEPADYWASAFFIISSTYPWPARRCHILRTGHPDHPAAPKRAGNAPWPVRFHRGAGGSSRPSMRHPADCAPPPAPPMPSTNRRSSEGAISRWEKPILSQSRSGTFGAGATHARLTRLRS